MHASSLLLPAGALSSWFTSAPFSFHPLSCQLLQNTELTNAYTCVWVLVTKWLLVFCLVYETFQKGMLSENGPHSNVLVLEVEWTDFKVVHGLYILHSLPLNPSHHCRFTVSV